MHKRSFLFTLGIIAARPALALYDPKPIALLKLAAGTWVGSLTYRDYQAPDKMVTLKTVMTVSLAAPDELVLYYVFDDGPGKTVYSYERMKFDLAANQLTWHSGSAKPKLTQYKITSATILEAKNSLIFEKSTDTKTDRYMLDVTKSNWSLVKYEIPTGGVESLRSKYEFVKREA
jgi:hypothetical protein